MGTAGEHDANSPFMGISTAWVMDPHTDATAIDDHAKERVAARVRILLVEDDSAIRETLGNLLGEEGYDVAFAENGRQALQRLSVIENLPDVIVLDLRMPVMDGWEFRAIQKDDPRFGLIPVVAVSADHSAPAQTISAQAYLHKPLDASTLLRTLDRVLFESERSRMSARLAAAERLASLGRVASGVGHEINNPLSFAMLNLSQAVSEIESITESLPGAAATVPPGPIARVDGPGARARLGEVLDMLKDCELGLERIRGTVGNLQQLSRQDHPARSLLNIEEILESSISIAWNQIRHRATLTRSFTGVPTVQGDAVALGQVFVNLLVNAAQAIPEGSAERNQIRVSTMHSATEIVVEVSDTGNGIPPEVQPHVFEPFFTTKPFGIGTGLGLSISHQTVTDHGGRIEARSEPGLGSVFRVMLPIGRAATNGAATGASTEIGLPNAAAGVPGAGVPTEIGDAVSGPLGRARVLVIDDEPMVARVISRALSAEHEVVVTDRAADALARLAEGEEFDLVLCDIVMPDVSGPEVYETIKANWPHLVERLVFMTGGAFTPNTATFIDEEAPPVLAKPFALETLVALVRDRAPIGRR